MCSKHTDLIENSSSVVNSKTSEQSQIVAKEVGQIQFQQWNNFRWSHLTKSTPVAYLQKYCDETIPSLP